MKTSVVHFVPVIDNFKLSFVLCVDASDNVALPVPFFTLIPYLAALLKLTFTFPLESSKEKVDPSSLYAFVIVSSVLIAIGRAVFALSITDWGRTNWAFEPPFKIWNTIPDNKSDVFVSFKFKSEIVILASEVLSDIVMVSDKPALPSKSIVKLPVPVILPTLKFVKSKSACGIVPLFKFNVPSMVELLSKVRVLLI